ncbi:MAG: hypothetical protein EOO73_05260 [Myxococcales bacterium]|nr:MAG: hypothetical protein EOO73_05260 [Myxococcales bacterium]
MSSEVVVFLGPTLDRATASALLPGTYLPPARQGDVLAASYSRPAAILLIDGYFDRVPAVWHKEILWAIEQGIPVLGASSMGALRAAELADFGMQGIGVVYERFRDGTYEDDDEVAVSHASEEHGFRRSSEAMVNIRATLARAFAAGVIEERTRASLLALAKRAFYPDRHYAELLRLARASGLSAAELQRLEGWLPSNRVDQKRADALELLTATKGYLQTGFPRLVHREHLSHTSGWASLLQQHPAPLTARATAVPLTHELLLDELILSERYRTCRAAAVTRALAVALSTPGVPGERISPEAVVATVEAFRNEQRLLAEASFEGWISEQRLSDEALSDLFANEARLRRSVEAHGSNLVTHLLDHLRIEGSFGELAERVEAKLVAFEGSPPLRVEQSGVAESRLWSWFAQHVGRKLPGSVEHYAREVHGLPPERVLLAITREYRYSLKREQGASAAAESDTP